jgi:hypothetical protein
VRQSFVKCRPFSTEMRRRRRVHVLRAVAYSTSSPLLLILLWLPALTFVCRMGMAEAREGRLLVVSTCIHIIDIYY